MLTDTPSLAANYLCFITLSSSLQNSPVHCNYGLSTPTQYYSAIPKSDIMYLVFARLRRILSKFLSCAFYFVLPAILWFATQNGAGQLVFAFCMTWRRVCNNHSRHVRTVITVLNAPTQRHLKRQKCYSYKHTQCTSEVIRIWSR